MLPVLPAANPSTLEDREMARLFRTELALRMSRRHSHANVINLRWPKAQTPAAPQDWNALFEVPLFNSYAA